jgi:hypothetical protein
MATRILATRWLRLGVGLIATAALTAVVWWALGPEAGLGRWLARSWARGLQHESSARVASDLRYIAALDAAGLDTLLDALGSTRSVVAESAAQALHDRMKVWRQWPAERSGPLAEQLARGLTERIGGWPASSQRVAADVALQLLDWPMADERSVDSTLLVDCERILRIVPLSSAATLGTSVTGNDAAQSRRSQSPPVSESGIEAGQKPGLLIPAPVAGEMPSAPKMEANPMRDQSAGLTFQPTQTRQQSGDSTAGRDANSSVWRGAKLGDAGRESAAGSVDPTEASREEEQTGLALVPPESASPDTGNMPPGDASKEARAWLAKRSELDLIFDRGGDNEDLRDAAEAELRRRGFRDYDFKLADKLISADPAERRQIAHLVHGLESGASRWLVWLSFDPDRSVRQAAVALMVISEDPRIKQRLLKMEVTDADSVICERIRVWRERR